MVISSLIVMISPSWLAVLVSPPQSNSNCTAAEVDEDGDIDRDGFTIGVTGRLVDIVDLNEDEQLDAVVVNAEDISVMLGNGNGSFQPQQHIATIGRLVDIVDINGDERIDIVGVNSVGLNVLLGNGDGSFQ
jgi:hypothetical protein